MQRDVDIDEIMRKATPTDQEPGDGSREAEIVVRPSPIALADGRLALSNHAEIMRMAQALAGAGMMPPGVHTAQQAFWVLLAGYEAGLSVTQTIKNVMLVNGRPSMWGDAVRAKILQSGLLVYINEVVDQPGTEKAEAVCVLHRKAPEGRPPLVIERRFGVADAKAAGLWGKAGPWKQYPMRMLQNRAWAFAARDGFSDVLGGLDIAEELSDHRGSFDPSRARGANPAAEAMRGALEEGNEQ